MIDKHVLVAGASGLVGHAVLKHFSAQPEVRVTGVSRRRPFRLDHLGIHFVSADLRDQAQCQAVFGAMHDVTHVVYAALHEQPALIAGWREEEQITTNDRMLRYLLEPLARAAARLRHVTLLQGTKAYGAHVRRFDLPAREGRSEARDVPNFYWNQEEYLKTCQRDAGWAWTIFRPQIIFGQSFGSAMNPIPAIGVYAALLRERGEPLYYPGGPSNVLEAVDADLLARAIAWAGEADAARNDTFNITNGDVFQWSGVWPAIADALGMKIGPSRPRRLAETVPAEASKWEDIRQRHGLVAPSMADYVGASLQYLDYLMAYGATTGDKISIVSTVKLRQAGFGEAMDTEAMFRKWFKLFEEQKLLPPALPGASVNATRDADAAAIARNFSLQDLSQSFYDDPYPTYRALQSIDPIHRMPDGSLFLTRHRDLEAIYKDTTRFSSDKRVEFAPKFGTGSLLFQHHTTSLVFNDPPLHSRVRRLIAGALNPRAIAEMEPALIALVERLLDSMQARGEADLIEDFASAIPVEIIGNLLAIPHEHRGPLRSWSLAILGALEPVLSAEARQFGERAVEEFLDYLRRLVADRRRHPGDVDRDVLTCLISGETAGESLSEIELLQNCIFILNAGHETTTNLIGNGLELLIRYPQQRQRLIDDPSLIKIAIEEFLRFESSNQLGNRRVVEGVEIDGMALPKGTLITLCIGAANRDPEQFSQPDQLDISRWPNRHLAFASGPHACAGLNLARLEGRIAIGHFLARFPRFVPAGPPLRARRARFRGFTSLPVTLG